MCVEVQTPHLVGFDCKCGVPMSTGTTAFSIGVDKIQVAKEVIVTNLLNGNAESIWGSCIYDIRINLEYRYPGCNIRLFHKNEEIPCLQQFVDSLSFIKVADSRKAVVFLERLVRNFISRQLWRLKYIDVWNKGTNLGSLHKDDTSKAMFALQMVLTGHPTNRDKMDLLELFVLLLAEFCSLHRKTKCRDISSAHFPEELIDLVGTTVGDICATSCMSLLADIHFTCNDFGKFVIDKSISRLNAKANDAPTPQANKCLKRSQDALLECELAKQHLCTIRRRSFA